MIAFIILALAVSAAIAFSVRPPEGRIVELKIREGDPIETTYTIFFTPEGHLQVTLLGVGFSETGSLFYGAGTPSS